MRDFSADHRWLSLNTATVRKQGDLIAIIEACARHGIRAIDPGATRSLPSASTAPCARCATPGSNCRAIAAAACSPRMRRTAAKCATTIAAPIDEAKALGAPCIVLVVGGLAAIFAAGQRGLKGYRGGAHAGA